jgi:serine/threonine-protein kinase RsbW
VYEVSTVVTSITDRAGDLSGVRNLLGELARTHALEPSLVTDMQIALDEVLSNIFEHGFIDGRPHQIRVVLSLTADILTAEVEDDCRPFNPLSVEPPETGASLHARTVGGLGIHFVRSLTDEVHYSRVRDRNRLVLRKHLNESRTEVDDGPA